MKLLHNPLIRFVGIAAVLYFALLANKNNPESLGNRLSPQNIKQNLSEMTERGKFITTNVKAAKAYSIEQMKDNVANSENVNSAGKIVANCGAEVDFILTINTANGKNLKSYPKQTITIGSKQNKFLEEKLIGMTSGVIREIMIQQQFQTDDVELQSLIKEANSDLIYQIVVDKIIPASNPQTNCE